MNIRIPSWLKVLLRSDRPAEPLASCAEHGHSSAQSDCDATIRDETEDGSGESHFETGQLKLNGKHNEIRLEGFHKNAQVPQPQACQEDTKNGAWELFHKNGQLRSRGNYQDGKRCGHFEVFHANGQLRSRGNHKDDTRDGHYESYFENGQLESRGIYVEGEKHGSWEQFYESGQLRSSGSYSHGKRDGCFEEYRENGRPSIKECYRDD